MFDGEFARAAQIACTDGYCRLTPRARDHVPGLEGDLIDVDVPSEAEIFSSQEDVLLAWSAPPGVAIIVVLARVPRSVEDLLEAAVWGAAVADPNTRSVRIADGVAIRSGGWTDEAATLPLDRPLYVLVEVVSEGKLVSASAPRSFLIGSAWPGAQTDCVTPGVVNDACHHPARLQACHPLTSTCTAVCLSYRDCLDVEDATDCGPLRGGLRYCE